MKRINKIKFPTSAWGVADRFYKPSSVFKKLMGLLDMILYRAGVPDYYYVQKPWYRPTRRDYVRFIGRFINKAAQNDKD